MGDADPGASLEWDASETAVLAAVRRQLNTETTPSAVLATVVDVEGNAYRRPGAKMLVDDAGTGTGLVTAGCLEDDVIELAEEVLADGNPRVVTFDLTDDEHTWGRGMGCDGIVDLLLEPVSDCCWPLVAVGEDRRPRAILTVLESDDVSGGEGEQVKRASFDPASGTLEVPTAFPSLDHQELASRLATVLDRGETVRTTIDGVDLFIESVTPPPQLLLVGTGPDVGPIIDVAVRTGFEVTVVGYRRTESIAERFPDGVDVVETSPGRLRSDLPIRVDTDTYAVIATHNFVDDRVTVDRLLETPLPYLGLMGPDARFGRMKEAFEAEGDALTDAELERIFTPVGLDLGDGSPAGIAVSVVAELLAVHNERDPQHLSELTGSIHGRPEQDP